MNLNKVLLIGRLTQDPETRSTPSGQTVTTIRMATNRTWTNQQTGQRQDAAEYHTVVAWGRLAEIATQYLKRGGLAMIEGRLQTRSWDDKATGAKRYMTEVVAENLQLGPRSDFAGGGAPMNDVKRPAPKVQTQNDALEPEIPIIDENELAHHGIEEEEVKIKEDDLPF
jgi:single-strand DNA-binding protein